jgi:hypothetical protein
MNPSFVRMVAMVSLAAVVLLIGPLGAGNAGEKDMATINSPSEPDRQPWDHMDPLQFLESLKPNPQYVVSVFGEAPRGWYKKEHVDALLGLLGSGELASPVHELKCPSLPKAPSTVGRQAAYLLLGYVEDHYPPYGNSDLGLGGRSDDQIRQMTAERLQGKMLKRER